MHRSANMDLWQGRCDIEDTEPALRWHQQILAWDQQTDLKQSTTLLGFACDEGVRRNQGRTGARNGPEAIRCAMANMAYFKSAASYDAGDIVCDNHQLESAQTLLAKHVTHILQHQGQPIILGGGHEMAWGSFQGLANYLQKTRLQEVRPKPRIGIINFDAHFDLRHPNPQPNSGTPFRQIAQWCHTYQQPFHYLVFGISPTANTQALFDYANNQVRWHIDEDCTLYQLTTLTHTLAQFFKQIDVLYLSICLDVFTAAHAPGVSAPSALGIDPLVTIKLIKIIKTLCKQHQVTLSIADIAELNPNYDIDQHTAKLAARLIHTIIAELI